MSSIDASNFEFLGTMAGNQAYLKGNDNKQTYCRVYEPFGAGQSHEEIFIYYFHSKP